MPNRLTKYFQQHRLSFRVLGAILLLSSLFTVLAIATQLYVQYRHDVAGIQQRLDNIETAYANTLSYSLWTLDYPQLDTQLQGILQLPDVAYVMLREPNGAQHAVGKPLPDDTPARTFTLPLLYQPVPGETAALGTLTVVANMSSVLQRLWDRLLVIIGTQAVKTFGMSVCILLLFHYLVTRHLGVLARYARRLDLAHLDEAPALPRKPPGAPDELDDVVRALDEMRQSLLRDIAARESAQAELHKLSSALQQSPEAILITDATGTVDYVNPRFTELTGFPADDLLGATAFGHDLNILQLEDTGQQTGDLRNQLDANGEWRTELRCRRRNGDLFWAYVSMRALHDEQGATTHYIIVLEDITRIKEYEDRLLHQANYDDLTGLPNRLLAFDRLSQAITVAQREDRGTALLYLDLDNFKHVNETLGHAAGDVLLREAARRLQACAGDNASVARFAGDEFLIIVPDSSRGEPLEFLAQHILDTFSAPFELEGQRIFCTATLGIAIYPDDGKNAQTLLRNADAALYAAKRDARNSYSFFTTRMNTRARARLRLEAGLRGALEHDELLLHYQPIINTADDRIVCMEALLRWQNPRLGLVMPDEILPLAEDAGLMASLGAWVLRNACRQAQDWLRAGHDWRIAVNVSPRQLRDANFARLVADILRDTGLPPQALELEFTENALLDDSPPVTRALQELKLQGVRLSLDDFGTGYSAVGRLTRCHFDVLKIDRSFIAAASQRREDAELVKAIVVMAHSLNLEVVGEGVEQAAQLDFLHSIGCDYAQGFHISKPQAAANVAHAIAR